MWVEHICWAYNYVRAFKEFASVEKHCRTAFGRVHFWILQFEVQSSCMDVHVLKMLYLLYENAIALILMWCRWICNLICCDTLISLAKERKEGTWCLGNVFCLLHHFPKGLWKQVLHWDYTSEMERDKKFDSPLSLKNVNVRDATQKKIRDFLGIFPKGGGGSSQFPKLLQINQDFFGMPNSSLGAKTCFTIVGRWYLINLIT